MKTLMVRKITEAGAAGMMNMLKNLKSFEGAEFSLLDENGNLIEQFKSFKQVVPSCPGNNKWVELAKTMTPAKPAPAKPVAPAALPVYDVNVSVSASGGKLAHYNGVISITNVHSKEMRGELGSKTAQQAMLMGLIACLKEIKRKSNVILHINGPVRNAIENGWVKNWAMAGWIKPDKKEVADKDLWIELTKELQRVCIGKVHLDAPAPAPQNIAASAAPVAANDNADDIDLTIPELPDDIDEEEVAGAVGTDDFQRLANALCAAGNKK